MDKSTVRLVDDTEQTFLTVAEARVHLRVDADEDDDNYIAGLIDAALDHVELVTGLYLSPRIATERISPSGFSVGERSLAIVPVRELSSVVLRSDSPAPGVFPADDEFAPGKLRLADGVFEDLSTYLAGASFRPYKPYHVYERDAFASLEWGAMYLRYNVGAKHDLPLAAPLKQAMLLYVGDLYAHRELSEPMTLNDNPAFRNLLWNYRLWR